MCCTRGLGSGLGGTDQKYLAVALPEYIADHNEISQLSIWRNYVPQGGGVRKVSVFCGVLGVDMHARGMRKVRWRRSTVPGPQIDDNVHSGREHQLHNLNCANATCRVVTWPHPGSDNDAESG